MTESNWDPKDQYDRLVALIKEVSPIKHEPLATIVAEEWANEKFAPYLADFSVQVITWVQNGLKEGWPDVAEALNEAIISVREVVRS